MDSSKDNTGININMHIDTLLERYLSLLDEYTALRETLNSLQRDIYQGIARANFSAERGIRYGADLYDQRMQATRKVEITSSKGRRLEAEGDAQDHGGDGDGEFRILVKTETPPPPPVESEDKDVKKDGDEEKAGDGGDNPAEDKAEEDDQDSEITKESAGKDERIKIKSNDPLRWFGLLTPLPLRQAQANAIKAVEEIIPRLASVNMAMAEVELEVRRARKKRAKAVAAAEKAERAGKAAEAGEEVQDAA